MLSQTQMLRKLVSQKRPYDFLLIKRFIAYFENLTALGFVVNIAIYILCFHLCDLKLIASLLLGLYYLEETFQF